MEPRELKIHQPLNGEPGTAAPSRCSPFTLIELLVVVAIIAVLAALLLPALSRARDTGKQAVCESNLKQIGAAVMMYTTDWNEYFPGAMTGSGPFFSSLETYTGVTYSAYKPPKIYFCPADAYRARITSQPGLAYFSYGQSYYCRHDAPNDPTVAHMSKIIRVKRPSTVIYLLDGKRTKTGEEGWPFTFSGNSWPFKADADEAAGSADFRHRVLTKILYVDMHTGGATAGDLLGTTSKFTTDW